MISYTREEAISTYENLLDWVAEVRATTDPNKLNEFFELALEIMTAGYKDDFYTYIDSYWEDDWIDRDLMRAIASNKHISVDLAMKIASLDLTDDFRFMFVDSDLAENEVTPIEAIERILNSKRLIEWGNGYFYHAIAEYRSDLTPDMIDEIILRYASNFPCITLMMNESITLTDNQLELIVKTWRDQWDFPYAYEDYEEHHNQRYAKWFEWAKTV